MADKKPRKISMEQVPFIGVLLLFAGFSLYGILSFNASLDDYVDSMYTSVIDEGLLADGGIVLDDPLLYTLEVDEADEIFTDVSGTHPNATAVAYFKQMGYVGGYSDGTFKPDQLVNRAEMLTILTNVVDADFAGGFYENCFTDVADEWFAVYICYAKGQAWVDGYSDGSYHPAQTVVKAEALKIAMKAIEVDVPESVDESLFGDVSVNDWFAPYAAVAKEGQIVTGSLFFPTAEMTRASLVQMIYNTMLYQGEL